MDYKEIDDYPNYLIYRDGRVWSKNRKRFKKNQTHVDKRIGKENRMVITIQLCKNGKQKTFYLARLLGIAFIPNPLNLPEIDHIDRNSLNNDLSNLHWVNRSQNSLNTNVRKDNKLGLKYISKDRNIFKFRLRRYKYEKYFKTEEEAILHRNMFLESVGEDYENIDT